MQLTEQDKRVGTVIDGFVLRHKVCSNGRTAVYQAHGDGTVAAVKIICGSVAGDPLERMRREAHIQGRVAHPSVARLLGGGLLDDGSPYLVTEWIEGPALADRLNAGPFAMAELMPILGALADGLRAIHAAGIVHRDLKPSNIVLPASGRPPAVILDFGHSLAIDEIRLTQSGWILGTASYMAPEQVAGQPLDGRADLYSLGVILYQALTGELPGAPGSSEPLVPPRRRAPARGIPASAEDLCLWLMMRDVTARLPSAQVLAVTLRAMISMTDDIRSAQCR